MKTLHTIREEMLAHGCKDFERLITIPMVVIAELMDGQNTMLNELNAKYIRQQREIQELKRVIFNLQTKGTDE